MATDFAPDDTVIHAGRVYTVYAVHGERLMLRGADGSIRLAMAEAVVLCPRPINGTSLLGGAA